MPANRSRTDRWKDSLHRIYERGGGLEFAIKHDQQDDGVKDLVWRVKLLHLTDKEMVIEHHLMGRQIELLYRYTGPC